VANGRRDILRIAALFAALHGPALAQQYSFRHYGTAEGLQNLTVLSLAQDGTGFIWVGTEGGLYRYDGSRFHLMQLAEGLPCSTEVHGLFVATDGALWVNTCSQVFRLDGQRFRAVAGLSGMFSVAQAMADGQDGKVLVGTPTGLYEAVPDGAGGFSAHPYPLPADLVGKSARAVARIGTQLWFGCGREICVAEGARINEIGPAQGLPEDAWDGIAKTTDGSVWLRSPSRLYRQAPGAPQPLSDGPKMASSMFWGAVTTTRDGTVLVPTDKGLVVRRDDKWKVIDERQGLPAPMVSSVLEDREGSIWVGLIGDGVARSLGYGQWEAWTKTQGLPSDLIWSIRRDRRGALWVGTSLGLARLEKNGPPRIWARENGLGGDNVRSLSETPDGAIWAVVKPGDVARIDPGTEQIRLFGREDGLSCNTSHRGFVDHLGRLWIASSCGVFRSDHPSAAANFYRIEQPEAFQHGAWAFAEDQHGIMWITGPEGLWRLGQGQWRRYRKADGLLTDNPYIPLVAADGAVWVHNRFDAGIERVEFSGDRIVRATTVLQADPSSVEVTALLGFDAFGKLWRGSANGISTLVGGSWRYLGIEDGLIWNDTDGDAFWADSDGSIWIGTSRGLSHYRQPPVDVADPVADPAITRLEVDNKSRSVRVEFSSLRFKSEQVVKFAYRLDGGRWVDTTDRVLSMAGQAPGRHRLEIRSRVRDGPFSPRLAAVEFRFEPKWWETWWTRLSLLAILMGTVSGAIWWRHQRLLKQRWAELEAEHTRIVEEKQSADAEIEAKARFLANMSHELRTPLNGVIGLTQELEGMPLSAEAMEIIRTIRSSGDTLLRVISDVLDFARIEAGNLELEIAPFEIRRCILESTRLFRAVGAEKGLRLSCQLAPELPEWVDGDGSRLRQVLLNLVSNAVKFTHTGEVALTAEVVAEDEDSHTIAVEVRDTGVGIPPEQVPRLFTSFHQADTSISRRFGGTGLGLAISSRLVSLMGGTIEVESTVGVGSRFRFTARLGRAENPAPSRHAPEQVPGAGHLQVLVAEDNPVNQRVLVKQLKKLGIRADVVADGAQAITAALRQRYDLVLMDLQMPEVDGITATIEIRQRAPSDRQPLIFAVTAHAMAEYRDTCINAGMDGYLTKPVDSEKLRSLIEEMHQPHISLAMLE